MILATAGYGMMVSGAALVATSIYGIWWNDLRPAATALVVFSAFVALAKLAQDVERHQ